MPNTIITQLTRYFSNRRKPKQVPIVDAPISPRESPSSHSTFSSGHSSSCSINPTPGTPSFIQVLCNDSQSVCSMDTVPLYKPSPLLPGIRKQSSFYEITRDEIIKERMKSTMENEEQVNSSQKSIKSVHSPIQPSPSYRQRDHNREGRLDEYAFGHHYGRAPIYRDGVQRDMNSREYYDKDVRYSRHRDIPYQPLRSRAPVHPGPFRSQEGFSREDRFGRSMSRSIPIDPHFIRESSIRQGPYHMLQHPNSPYEYPYYEDFRERSGRHYIDDVNEIPTTRITRLREPGKYWRNDGVKSDAGGHISGMAASRSVSFRRTASTKTTKAEIGSQHLSPERKVFPLIKSLLFQDS